MTDATQNRPKMPGSPFRVVWVSVSGRYGDYGWASHAEGFDSEQAARDALAEPFERGVKKARIEKMVWNANARDPFTGEPGGCWEWKRIAGRKNRSLK